MCGDCDLKYSRLDLRPPTQQASYQEVLVMLELERVQSPGVE
jgi:hypothetical protein